VRGAEVVLGLRRVGDGYAKLHFLKDRDGDLPISTAWGLLFDQEEGFRSDPSDGVVRDLRGELLELLADSQWWTLNKLRKPADEGGVAAHPDKLKPELEAMTDEHLLEYARPAGHRTSGLQPTRRPRAGLPAVVGRIDARRKDSVRCGGGPERAERLGRLPLLPAGGDKLDGNQEGNTRG